MNCSSGGECATRHWFSMQQDARAAVPTPAEMIARARALIPVAGGTRARGRAEALAPASDHRRYAARPDFFRVLQPRRWGGYEMDMATYWEIQLALAEGLHVDRLGLWRRWRASLADGARATTAPHAISGARTRPHWFQSSLMPAGTAVSAAGGFRLSGHWKFSSGCEHCGWAFLGVNASLDPAKPPDRCVMLVPRRDYRIVDTWHVSGLKATGSQDIVVEDAFVPAHRVVQFSGHVSRLWSGTGREHRAALSHSVRTDLLSRRLDRGARGPAGHARCVPALCAARASAAAGRTAEDPVARLVCAEVAAAVDEMKTMLMRDFRNLADYAERGELPPIALRMEYKFHSAMVAERCSVLASRLFKAAGGAGIYSDQPFGRVLADINAARQHISNQFENDRPQLGGRAARRRARQGFDAVGAGQGVCPLAVADGGGP